MPMRRNGQVAERSRIGDDSHLRRALELVPEDVVTAVREAAMHRQASRRSLQ